MDPKSNKPAGDTREAPHAADTAPPPIPYAQINDATASVVKAIQDFPQSIQHRVLRAAATLLGLDQLQQQQQRAAAPRVQGNGQQNQAPNNNRGAR